MDKTPYYRAYLHTALAREYNTGQVEHMISQFDTLADVGKPELGFRVVMESFGNENSDTAFASVADYIARQMGKYNATHKGINNTPSRLKELITRLNTNIQNLAGVTVNGVTLTQDELDNAKVNMPLCMTSKVFESVASVNNPKNRGCDKLTLEIRF